MARRAQMDQAAPRGARAGTLRTITGAAKQSVSKDGDGNRRVGGVEASLPAVRTREAGHFSLRRTPDGSVHGFRDPQGPRHGPIAPTASRSSAGQALADRDSGPGAHDENRLQRTLPSGKPAVLLSIDDGRAGESIRVSDRCISEFEWD